MPPARPQRDPRTTQSHGRSAPYRIRRLLTKADERLEDSDARLLGLSRAGDSRGEVATTRHAKEAVRELYAHGDESTRREWIERLVTDMADRDNPLRGALAPADPRPLDGQIVARHPSHVSNRPTEAANNPIKRVKRANFSFSSFRNFRVRALFYAGKSQVAPTRDHHIPAEI